jgi:hypothetical protein
MLNNTMHLTNNNSKILIKLVDFLNSISVKTILHAGLLLFWSVIIFGTFKEFI